MRSCLWLLAAVATWLAAALAQAADTSVVVVPDKAHRTERYAAAELARYLPRSGEEPVPVLTESQAGAVTQGLWVGRTRLARVPDDLAGDGFLIERVGARVVLCGGSPRGTLSAAHRYLEKAHGWRWLQPGSDGEVRTTLTDPGFPQGRVTDAPRFAVRGLVRPWTGVQRWYAKLGLNYALVPVRSKLSQARIDAALDVGLSLELGEHGFSIFAPKGGVICPNDAAALSHGADKLLALAAAHPFVDTFGFWPNDGTFVFCVCPACGPMHPGLDLDGRYLRIVNAVAAQVHRTAPDVGIGFLAYNHYLRPPADVRPYTRNVSLCYAAPMLWADIDDPARRDRYVEGIRAWLALGLSRVWVYEYYHNSSDLCRLNALTPRAIGREMRLLSRLGASGLMAQINNPPSRNWGVGLNYYVMAKLLWDPEQDEMALVRDYCTAAYGAGGPAMAEFVDRYERACGRMARMWRWPEDTPAGAAKEVDQHLAECAVRLDEALRSCSRPEGRVWIERWKLTLAAARHTATALGRWVEAKQHLAQGAPARAASAFEEAKAEAECVGKIVDPKQNRIFTFTQPLEIVARSDELARAVATVGMEVHVPRLGLRLIPLAKNTGRGRDQLVLYTPDRGPTTATNKWGTEVVVDQGRVTDVQWLRGSAAIPRNGFVLSGHGRPCRDMWRLQRGDAVILRPLAGPK